MERCAFCNNELSYVERTTDIDSAVLNSIKMKGRNTDDISWSTKSYPLKICEICSKYYNLALSGTAEGHSKAVDYLTDCLGRNPSMNHDVMLLVSDLMESPEDKERRRLEEEKNRLEEKLRIERKIKEAADFKRKLHDQSKNVIVTTTDLKEDYEVIGPVFYQISNKGIVSSALSQKKQQYSKMLTNRYYDGQASDHKIDYGFLVGEWSVGQNNFDSAFFIAVEELKLRAKRMGADAIVGMRQDIDIDTNGFSYFYLQMYGTAVRFKNQ